MSEKQTTTGLFRILANAPTIKHALETFEDEASFLQYLSLLLSSAGLDIPKLAEQMYASKVFIYQIFEGIRKPGREILLRMAFATGLTLEQTQKLLALARRGTLYPRVRRDTAIIYAIQHGFTLEEADEALRSIQEEPLLPAKE